jgi:hypothetical protein
VQQDVRLAEEGRTRRRTVADAANAVHQRVGFNEVGRAEIRIGPMQLPSGKKTALVDVVFPELGCIVSLATSDRFKARHGTSSRPKEFRISLLDRAEVCGDGSVLLTDGTRIHAVEVRPTHMPYQPSERDYRILMNVIAQTKSFYCFRSLHYGLPDYLKDEVTDCRFLDYSRVRTIQAPPLKVIQGCLKERGIKATTQKIADALATFGIRQPTPRCSGRVPQSN